jgi:hypothetical protein
MYSNEDKITELFYAVDEFAKIFFNFKETYLRRKYTLS